MYVEFMNNFLLADSSELLAARLILNLLSPKNVSFLFSRHDVRRVHENFLSRLFERADGFCHFSLLSPKTFDSYFLDMMYVEFMKNSYLADSREPMAVKLISPSWAQKRLIPTFSRPIRASCWLLDSFWPPEPKNVWFLLSRHDVRRVLEKFVSHRFERADGC